MNTGSERISNDSDNFNNLEQNEEINSQSDVDMDVEHMIENDKSNVLLIQRKNHISSGKEEITIDSCYHCHIELLRILKRKGVPLCLFDEIMN